MILYYNRQTKTWGHHQPNQSYVWGLQNIAIPKIETPENSLSFPVRMNHKKAGPLIGILTSKRCKKTFAGNRKTFRRIHYALKENGGISFVFTPEGIKPNQINGYLFDETNRKWLECVFPFPDLVYNRIPYRKDEQTSQMKQTFQWLQNHSIPFFNPHFFTKFECYQLLYKNKKLKPFLPTTFKLQSKIQLKQLLQPNCRYYAKPNNGLKGDGIFTIECEKKNHYIVKDHNKIRSFSTFNQLWDEIFPLLEKDLYILQTQIHLNCFEGRPYDFRLHVQRHYTDWVLTGVGIRCSAIDGITTHVPKGGSILTVDDIEPPVNDILLQFLAKEVAEQLENEYGKLGEFSMDVGRDTDGNYWIFEINSKPMVFDEVDIQQKGIHNLLQTFYTDTGFIREGSATNAIY
ncbi:YheC/YheD family protein [Anaerobacillus sp. MEB173]|uniref:YheC/YheD family endospore coat-associated protein n=1 Tax=Anaerobacillus sp. MEB173 TaxID=3383345 RepID=UPI003F92F6E2